MRHLAVEGERDLAVEGEREVAERVGHVRSPVVHRLGPQRLQLVVASVDLDWFLISRAHSGVTSWLGTFAIANAVTDKAARQTSHRLSRQSRQGA